MPTLFDLVNGDSNFSYYSGKGNFTQKSIPFGKDRPGGGSSGQPYVTTSPNDVTNIGIIDSLLEAKRDVTRVAKFLVDAPRGPLFIGKQVGLQMMNPKMESLIDPDTTSPFSTSSKLGRLGNSIAKGINRITTDIGVTRIFNPLCTNLLAQVAGSFIGEHFVRAGLTLNMDDHDKYTYIATTNEANDNNRLVSLLRGLTWGGDNVFPKLKSGEIYSQHKELFSYGGGGNSTYGIGRTSIKSYGSTFAAEKSAPIGKSKYVPIPYSDVLNISSEGTLRNTSTLPNTLSGQFSTFDFRSQDFRAYKKALSPANNEAYQNYQQNTDSKFAAARKGLRLDFDTLDKSLKNNIYERLGIINTTKNNFKTNYEDRINALSIYYGSGDIGLGGKDMNGKDVNKERVRDLIKFRIKALDNDKLGSGTFIVFRAFLHSNPTDNTVSIWNAIKYVGRGESFYSYDGVENQMSVGFTIVAFSRQEMMPLYQKLNYLKSTMYPDYTASGKMRGTIHEITIGDYIKYQPCVITSLNISIPEETTWEIAMNSPDNTSADLDKDMHELPMMLKVSIEFNPIWKFLPKKGTTDGTSFTTPPFIGIDNEVGSDRANEWATNVQRKDPNIPYPALTRGTTPNIGNPKFGK
jgi:hypothetical protein